VPELPEVETIRRQLDPLLAGSVVVDAWAFPSPKFTDAPLAVGARIDGVRRRGKYLLLPLDHDGEPFELVVHLGMTGRLAVDGSASRATDGRPAAVSSWEESAFVPRTGHLRARWLLDDGRTLWFDDVRRFGRIAVVRAGEHAGLPTLAALGPEPFDDAFTPEHLRARVHASDRAIKTQLLSQRVVAGVGNIYADEALWRAHVHPASRRITRAQAVLLRDSIRDVLAEGIRNGGTTLRNYRDAEGGSGTNQRHLDCYGRAGEPCARCATVLRRGVIDARSTTWCPSCQRRRG
jgi:formamidopyrimidine-DNA glycosylase